MKRQVWALFISVTAALAGTMTAQAEAAITTDQSDYPPGSTVHITGTGFWAGETVQLQVLRIDLDENTGPEHLPWQVNTDGNGRFETIWEITLDEWGATLQLTARGLDSGLVAQVIFTDSTITAATGGSAISADTAGGAYTALTGPTMTETVIGDISTGTIDLNAPPGFVFDTSTPAPYLELTTGDSNANKNINNLTVGSTVNLAATTTTITFTISQKSNGQTRNTLVFHNIRVRPTAGTPLASGNITDTGTATMPGVTLGTNGTSFGTLVEVPGAASTLAFATQPSGAIAGNAFATQPVVQTQDAYGNNTTAGLGSSIPVTIAIKTGTGTLQGTTAYNIGSSYGNGTITGSGLRIDQSGTFTLGTTAPGFAEEVSSPFAVPNATPLALAKSVVRAPGLSLKMLKTDLLAGATDANGDSVSLSAVQSPSAGGATVTAPTGSWVFYLPNTAGNGDTFSYTISDGHGGTDTKTVTVNLVEQGGTAQNVSYSAGGITVTFAGIPGYTYDVQRSADGAFTSPTVMTTTNAPSAGVFTYTDSSPLNPSGYYRLKRH